MNDSDGPRLIRNLPHLAGIAAALFVSAISATAEGPLELRLPTANQALFSGEPEKFYMYVPRVFEGETSQPWEGGQFGFVRTPIRTDHGIVFTHFHEGIDIVPMQRDSAGNPLDPVNAIAAGTVVHASTVSSHSNYGKYVVVQHNLDGGAYFSLYAHLAEITCQPGDTLAAGDAIGRLGFTGAGITRPRAHLHLEFALLLNSRFDDWHVSQVGGVNRHGPYNGMNLAGLDIANLYLKHHANPNLSLVEFIRATPTFFKVVVPRQGPIDLVTRNPWLLQGPPEIASPSWEFSFAATGLPLAIAPCPKEVSQPEVSFVVPSEVPHRYLTRGLLSGQGSTATLSPQGVKFIRLVTGDFAAPSPQPPETKKPAAKKTSAR